MTNLQTETRSTNKIRRTQDTQSVENTNLCNEQELIKVLRFLETKSTHN